MKPHEAVETKLYPLLKSALYWDEWVGSSYLPLYVWI